MHPSDAIRMTLVKTQTWCPPSWRAAFKPIAVRELRDTSAVLWTCGFVQNRSRAEGGMARVVVDHRPFVMSFVGSVIVSV